MPKSLTVIQKKSKIVRPFQKLLECIEEDPRFLDNIITWDESWFFQYNPETKCHSNEWYTLQSPQQKKARMSKSRMKAMLIVFFDKNGFVHSEFVLTIPQPSYSPDLARAEFFLFPKVKSALKKRHHGTLDDVKRACM
ncbi:histone-lysine n-methyltransferase setmar-like protein [Trichonephila clavipes]|uniref:Histone-lysine n-methyltransferase setmar-like protein n=1 Tax=Trichonephila clavipes TaxID=2585209 RepID=A0A8X6RGU5_TRICX|nr:histone-lysine n-methyltransferase setmar-like protein [Trichonephila clavipes]